MKNTILIILLCGVILVGMMGCKREINVNVQTMTVDGIIMEIKDGTLTNERLTLIIKDTTDYDYIFGEEFYIEEKTNDGWVRVKEIHNDYGFNEIAYYANNGNGLELEQDWKYIYGSLEKGIYRLIKTTFKQSDTPTTEKSQKYYISVDFEIK